MADTTADAVHATAPMLESSTPAAYATATEKAQKTASLISVTDAAAAAQAEQERAVGITKYVSPDAPGFSCIVKQRYTDFLVNEIRPTGEVLHLTELVEPAKKLSRDQKRANANAEGGAEANGEAG
jgi:tRNA pseudouridine13 synthase